jgi:hypothetical protein
MTVVLRRYTIKAYSEWETLDVETECPDDQHAIDKARRYGSLQYFGLNFPPVIFAHVICNEDDGPREVGTWECRVRYQKPGHFWHEGTWVKRPMPEDRPAIWRWKNNIPNGS